MTLTIQRNVFDTVQWVAHELHNLENHCTKHRSRNTVQNFFSGRCFKSDRFSCVGGQSTWDGVSKKGWEQGSAASAPGHVPALTSALAAALTWTSDAPWENPTAYQSLEINILINAQAPVGRAAGSLFFAAQTGDTGSASQQEFHGTARSESTRSFSARGSAASAGPCQPCQCFPAITCPQIIPSHHTG